MRTFEQILQVIVDEKTVQLPELNSTSSTAIWRVWANIVALSIYAFEQIVYSEQSKLEKLAEMQRYGSIDWYKKKAKEFQLGDPLLFDSDTGLYSYALIDPLKQIVASVAVGESDQDQELLIKVAKDDGGVLVPLDSGELLLFNSYISEIRVAGVDFQGLSLEADVIDSVATVYYDGNYTLNDIQTAINDVLNTYKNDFSFNGVVLKNDVIRLIRNVAGIDDVLFSSFTGKQGQLLPAEVVRDYNTVSGYFNYEVGMLSSWEFVPRFENSI